MIDELERLLQVKEEEKEQVADELNIRAAGYAGIRENRALPAEAQEEERIPFSGISDNLTKNGLESGGEPGEELRGEENARGFYRLLAQTKRMVQTAARPAEKTRTPMVRQERAETRTGQDARWLDRIFQRDARRYDGGFTWQ